VLEQNFIPPETSTEEVLAQIWVTILGLEYQVGIHSNFFDLGGHSLLATQIVSRVREEFQVELSLRTLFEQPTIAGLARVITETRAARTEKTEMSRLLTEIESLLDNEATAMIAKCSEAKKP